MRGNPSCRPSSLHHRCDVLVGTEEIRRVVCGLDRGQACVVGAIRLLHPILSLLALEFALYTLLAGAVGCGPAARSAKLARDDELADFLCGAHEGIVEEARRLLAQRVAE